MCLKLALSQEKEIKIVLYILCRASLLFLLLVMSFFYLSVSLPLKVSMLNFELGPYFGYALSNTNIGGIYL
jgi:hypothetical protein